MKRKAMIVDILDRDKRIYSYYNQLIGRTGYYDDKSDDSSGDFYVYSEFHFDDDLRPLLSKMGILCGNNNIWYRIIPDTGRKIKYLE